MMTLSIPKPGFKRNRLKTNLAVYLLMAPFFFGFLTGFLGMPGVVRYTMDIAWCLPVVLALKKGSLRLHRSLLPMACLAAIFLLYTLVCIIFRLQSPVWYLWGLRNNFRFYAAFFIFAAFLRQDDTEQLFRVLDVLFWIHIGVSLFQFAALGIRQDFLGGIFGVERGRNAGYTIPFFLVMLSRWLLAMMNGTASLSGCMARCAAALLVAALAEMFGFFLMFGLIFLLAALLTRFSWRKCLLFLLLAAAVSVCSSLLLEMFGEGSHLTPKIILRRMFAENYATSTDLGRLTAIPTLCRTLVTDGAQRLFGLGLGNCDTSTFALCNSDFYRQYSYLHYTWFLSAFLFLETGFVGLGIYLLFFVACLIRAAGLLRRRRGNLLYCQMGMILSVLCLVLTFYNSALRAEGGYVMYFALALPFIGAERKEA